MTSTNIYIFGDQTVSVEEGLQSLLLIRDNPTLTKFLDEAYYAIQRQISLLPAAEKNAFPRAETLGLWLESVQKGRQERHAALDSAYSCLYEVGFYIYRGAQKEEKESLSIASYFLGICTGSFAAAAISCSKNIFDVTRLGVEATIVAFRVGMHVHRRASILGQFKPRRWTVIVSAIQESTVAQALSAFSAETKLPPPSHPYISAVGPNTVTVSGPPSVLDDLLTTTPFSDKKLFPIAIHGPYHASHVYTETDIEKITDLVLDEIVLQKQAVHNPLLSCASGAIINENDYGGLLRVLIADALVKQVRIDSIINGLAELISLNDSASITTLIPVNTQMVSSLTMALAQRGQNVQVEKSSIIPSPAIDKENSDTGDPGLETSKIAIVGYSGRFPEADGIAEFWDVLQKGLDVHKAIPVDRFDGEAHYDPTGRRKNTSQVLNGCWIKEPGLFDPRFFHMSPREACQTDPAQRLALLTAYEAMEMGGFVPDRTASSQRHRVGIFYGTTSDDWREVNSGQNVDTYFIPGGNRAFIPGRINYFFKFSGPSISVDTACSSSLAAIDIACMSLRSRNCDTAIAGGTNVMTNPDNFAGLDRGHFLSRTGNCKTFDDGADGYCRADGVGTVLLKRLADAIADKDPIFGIILGAHTNHSAESVSITRPLADAQEYLFRKLLSETGIKPYDVGYIEMHGTGTQAGDAVEMQSVLNTFAWDHNRPLERKLFLGSVKSNMGHAESASGVTALIKLLVMMKRNKIPPHCGIKNKINHGFPTDLGQRGVHIASSETEWLRPENRKRRAFVNNFSAAGGNTALLLEDAPKPSIADRLDPRTDHVVAISARSAASLKNNMISLAKYIGDSTSPYLLAQISYTTTARRIHHNRRVIITASDLQQLRNSILQHVATVESINPIPAKSPDIGLLFTGQGAQQTAMAQGLWQYLSSFRSDIHDFDAIARAQGLPSMLPLIDGSIQIEQLSPTVIQLGTCIIQFAMARLWINLGVTPRYTIGHSLGEYAALQVAGILSINDAIYLCGRRAALLEAKCTANTHGMVAVRVSETRLRQEIIMVSTTVEIACINGPEDTVLSGLNEEIDTVCQKLTENGHKFTRLPIPYAFHSSQVEPILDELEELARHIHFQTPILPFVSTVLGTVVTDGGIIGPQYIRRHCRETVNFLGAVQSAQREKLVQQASICIEVGSHPLLTRMMKSIVGPDLRCYPSLSRGIDAFKTLPQALSSLYMAGVTLNWDEYHRDFSSCHEVVGLPSYSWEYGNYWIQYEHDWCLTKGDPPAVEVSLAQTGTSQPIRISASVQAVIEQVTKEDHSYILTESDMKEPDLLQVAEDHRVNGLVLCPSSLYADIAYTLSKHLLQIRYPGKKAEECMPDICNMAVEKALIVHGAQDSQFFRAAMSIDWNTQQGSMELYSVDQSGERTILHARCSIRLQDPRIWLESWQHHNYLITRSIEYLLHGVDSGLTHKIRRGMAYKLFSSVVKYGPAFQGMQEVVFDSEGLEATARVSLQSVKGQYKLNPFWCDSFGHLTGFLMNSTDSIDLTDYVFVNHGWEYMRCTEPFLVDTFYQTYVKMQSLRQDGSAYAGDVYVLREDKIVAVYGQVTFNKVSRKLLELLLPTPSKTRNGMMVGPTNSEKVPSQTSKSISNSGPVLIVKQKTTPSVSLLQQALRAISTEIGVKESQLTDDTQFADLGVDSLMSLTILGIFRENLGLDVPSSLMDDYPSVKALKDYLSNLLSNEDSGNEDSSLSSSSNSPTNTSTTMSTPTALEGEPVNGAAALLEFLFAMIAEETGVSTKILSETEDLSELGLDSLVSLNILGRAREELGLDLPHDIFLQYTQFSSLKSNLQSLIEPDTVQEVRQVKHPPSTSVMLQGSKNSFKYLFLFPDGSGSSTSYTKLPLISPDLCVIGLNCPYMKNPQDLKCGLQDLTGPYVAEIRRRQPKGPYNLAGWSAGGISAYDAAQQLVNEGEKVNRLILLDSPNPIGLEKLPPRFYKFLERSGAFGSHGGKSAPPWLIQHFLAFIDALDLYKPTPFHPSSATPKTTVIWAKDGVCKHETDARPERQAGDPKEMDWLLENRKDLGPNGWDQLLGRGNLTIESLDDTNHFTLVRQPSASMVAAIMRKAIME